MTLLEQTDERPSALLTPDMDPERCLTPEQREAKLRRVERIRERVIRRWGGGVFLYLNACTYALRI